MAVEKIIGIDISTYMLEQAANPIRKEDIKTTKIDLLCGNIFEIDLPMQSFDFIYSLGVLGERSPFDQFICNKLYNLLKPNGKLYFSVEDIASKKNKSLKRTIVKIMYPLLPTIFQKKFNERWKGFSMSHEELKGIMEHSDFVDYEISRHLSTAPKWKGAHYLCLAKK